VASIVVASLAIPVAGAGAVATHGSAKPCGVATDHPFYVTGLHGGASCTQGRVVLHKLAKRIRVLFSGGTAVIHAGSAAWICTVHTHGHTDRDGDDYLTASGACHHGGRSFGFRSGGYS
jgi:hypothetical protein